MKCVRCEFDLAETVAICPVCNAPVTRMPRQKSGHAIDRSSLSSKKPDPLARLAAARQLLDAYAGNLDEHASDIADHFDAGGDAQQAVQWHERSARWLQPRDALAALPHWQRAFDLGYALRESPVLARVALRACVHLLSLGPQLGGLDLPSGELLCQQGRALAAQQDRPDLEARLVCAFAKLLMSAGERTRALQLAQEALSYLPHLSNPTVYVAATHDVANTLLLVGRAADTLAVLNAALADGRTALVQPMELLGVLWMRAHALIQMGKLEQARAAISYMLQRLADHAPPSAAVLFEEVALIELETRGYPDDVYARIRDYVVSADESGIAYIRCDARRHLAVAQLYFGDIDSAAATIEEGLRIAAEKSAPREHRIGFDVLRARVLVARGDVVAARGVVEGLIANERGEPHRFLLSALIDVLIAADSIGERERIESCLARVDAIANERGNPTWQAAALWQRGRLARALGDGAGARRWLREALRIYTGMDATGWMARIERELAS